MVRPQSLVNRVLVVGFDGGTFDVLLPLADAGVMPNLAALLREAALATLRSTLPCITPVAWTTFLTGADPHEHGIWDYRYFDAASRRTMLVHAGRIPIPTLLDAVSQQGGEVVSIDLPMTWPVSPAWRGLVLPGLGTPSTAVAFDPYPEFRQRVAEAGIFYSLDPIWRRRPESLAELQRLVRRTELAFRARTAVAELADRCHDWRLMIVQFQHLDGLQHRAWHLLGPPINEGASPAWSAQVRRAYHTLDGCLGRLLELADRRRAAVLLLSDHGFGPFKEQIVMPELLARRGLLVRPSAWRRTCQTAARAAWRLRKFLHRRLTGGGTAHLARPISTVLDIDWQRTAALTLHGNLAALVYLNTPERFGTRSLPTPRLREQACIEVLGALAEARHPETGERLFLETLALQSNAGHTAASELPDLVAIPAPGYHTRHKVRGRSSLLRQEPMLTGTHRRDGMLACKAPAAANVAAGVADLRDVAPTILRLLGMQPPATMRGQNLLAPCPGLGDPEQQPHSPVSPAHPPLPAAVGMAADLSPCAHNPAAASLSEEQEAQVLARLRDLGYVE